MKKNLLNALGCLGLLVGAVLLCLFALMMGVSEDAKFARTWECEKHYQDLTNTNFSVSQTEADDLAELHCR